MQRIYSKIDDLAYVSWKPIEQYTPEPYLSIIKSFTNDEIKFPKWDNEYINTVTKTGSKTDLKVRDDISKDFEQAKDLIEHNWNRKLIKFDFGKKQEIIYTFKEDHYVILGLCLNFSFLAFKTVICILKLNILVNFVSDIIK